MDFKLPDIGEGIAEGEVVKWLVREGDVVREDQAIVQVMTDKATVEIPSPRAGRIRRLCAKEGEIVPVGNVLLEIDESGTGAANGAAVPPPATHVPVTEKAVAAPKTAPPPVVPPPTAAHAVPLTPAGAANNVAVAPAVRKMARDLDVDLSFLRGSGTGGRITAEDVQRAADARQAAETAAAAPVPATPRGEEERIPFRGIRRKTAERMVLSKRYVPHYAYMDELDVTALVALRQTLKADAEKQGTRLTYLPFIIRAVVDGLKQYPKLNSSVDEERNEIIVKKYYNIGIATNTPDGLMVPVVKDADRRTVFGIAQELERLATSARAGRIQVKDLHGGTFTITNVGSHGGLFAAPIVNYPEVAILAIQKISKRPVVRDDRIVIRDVMNMSISLDHRVVDGVEAVEFMNHVIRLLESPQALVG
jgi:pyruvate/2-oxoglutarate dehydrogenase complex dihydrolipoamide acyltransferase (E2) component